MTKRLLKYILIITTVANCNYTGGYDIISGTKAREEISSEVTKLSAVGTATIFSSTTVSCSSSSSSDTSGTVTEESESNDTYKRSNQFTFPSEDGNQVRIKGTISSESDRDFFYSIPPSSLSSPITLYYRMNSGTANCFVEASLSSELENDTNISINPYYGFFDTVNVTFTSSRSFDSSFYIFVSCTEGGDNTYDVVLSLSDITTTTSVSSASISQLTTSLLLGQFFLYSKIDTGKKYTQASLDKCINKLKTTIPAVSYVHAYSLLSAEQCGTTYVPLTEYMAAGLTCDLEEASFIQLGELGVP